MTAPQYRPGDRVRATTELRYPGHTPPVVVSAGTFGTVRDRERQGLLMSIAWDGHPDYTFASALDALSHAGALPLLVVLPLRTVNPLNGGFGNTKQAAIIKSRRRQQERAIAGLAMRAALNRRGNPPADWLPAVVTLTRISVAQMDTDGLAASNKGIRDGIADALGASDAPGSGIQWRYGQRKGKRGVFAVEVLLERSPRS